MSEVNYAVTYDGHQETLDGFSSPRAAVCWALAAGLRSFTVADVAAPAGFYGDYRCYRNGRPVADQRRTARPFQGRGRGYHQG